MKIAEDDLEFNFSDAMNIRKFDDCSHGLSHCMKAVDFVVELKSAYLFVEVKDPSNPRSNGCNLENDKEKLKNNEMRDCLKIKFRDTFLYRWAEQKVDKPIYFLVLITLEQPLLSNFKTVLQHELPIRKATSWTRPLVQTCEVLNIESWNRNFPKWQITRISEQTI